MNRLAYESQIASMTRDELWDEFWMAIARLQVAYQKHQNCPSIDLYRKLQILDELDAVDFQLNWARDEEEEEECDE